MPATLPGRDIGLLKKKPDAFLQEIVQRFPLSSHGLDGQYLLPLLGLLYDVVLQEGHERVDGSQAVVPCGRRAMSFVKDPIEISKDVLPREVLKLQSLDSDAFLVAHIVDILDKGIPVCGQGVGADIAFMGQILGEEPVKLSGKVCRCRHRPCRVSGKQKRLSESIAAPFRDTSRRSGGRTVPLPPKSGVLDKPTVWEDPCTGLRRYGPSEPDCEWRTCDAGREPAARGGSL